MFQNADLSPSKSLKLTIDSKHFLTGLFIYSYVHFSIQMHASEALKMELFFKKEAKKKNRDLFSIFSNCAG